MVLDLLFEGPTRLCSDPAVQRPGCAATRLCSDPAVQRPGCSATRLRSDPAVRLSRNNRIDRTFVIKEQQNRPRNRYQGIRKSKIPAPLLLSSQPNITTLPSLKI
jgi:hypothetical protein